MSDTIIVALISFLGTCIGSFAGMNLIKYRINQLEKKVEKHNNVLERVYDLEKSEAVIKEEIKVANHRIEDLENNH